MLTENVTQAVQQIITEEHRFHLREPIDLTVRHTGPYCFVGYSEFEIEGYGKDEDEALESFADVFSAMWVQSNPLEMADIHVSRFNGALVSKGLDRSESKHHYYVAPMANATIGSRAKMRENSMCRNGICCGSFIDGELSSQDEYVRIWPNMAIYVCKITVLGPMPFTYRGRSLTVAAQQVLPVQQLFAALLSRRGAGNPAWGRAFQRVQAGRKAGLQPRLAAPQDGTIISRRVLRLLAHLPHRAAPIHILPQMRLQHLAAGIAGQRLLTHHQVLRDLKISQALAREGQNIARIRLGARPDH